MEKPAGFSDRKRVTSPTWRSKILFNITLWKSKFSLNSFRKWLFPLKACVLPFSGNLMLSSVTLVKVYGYAAA